MPRTEHTTPLLKLPISSRIADKIDSICHTSLTTAYPKYLSELSTVYTVKDYTLQEQLKHPGITYSTKTSMKCK